jgi:hypothetical protein
MTGLARQVAVLTDELEAGREVIELAALARRPDGRGERTAEQQCQQR